MCLDSNFGVGGLLVRGGDASEFLNLASASLLVKTLGVTLLSDLEGNVDKDFNKGNWLLLGVRRSSVQLAGDVAVCSVRRNEGGNGNSGRVGKQLGDLFLLC